MKKINKKVIIFGSLGVVSIIATSIIVPLVLKKSKNKASDTSDTPTKIEEANKKIQAEAESPTGTITKKNKVTIANGETPNQEHLEINVPDGFTYTFKSATAVDENGKSQVTVAINVVPQIDGAEVKDATFEVTGFQNKVKKSNPAIDSAVLPAAVPTIKRGSNIKTANDVTADDLVAPVSSGSLTYAITRVAKSTTTTDGTTVTATITVTSSVSWTKTTSKTYNVEVSGFTSEKDKANAAIDRAVLLATAPTIKAGSITKTANDITADDLVAPVSSGSLTYTITGVSTFSSTVIATITVTSSVSGTKTTGNTYNVIVSGFAFSEIHKANAAIDSAVLAAAIPAIKAGSNTKTANDITADDLVAPVSSGSLTYEITKVAKSTTTTDGTTVTATITVTSSVSGTKTTGNTYNVEVSGFTAESVEDNNEKNAVFDFKKDLAKIENANSSKIKSALKIDIGSLQVGEVVAKNVLGYILPRLSSGVTATYKIKEKYVEATGKVVVTVTLTKENISNTKDIVITAKDAIFDYSSYFVKFQNSISAKNKSALQNDVRAKKWGTSVSAEQLGYQEPSLNNGVKASYFIKKAYDDSTAAIIVGVILSKDGETKSNAKDMIIIAKDAPFESNKFLIVDAVSSKDKAELNSYIRSKSSSAFVSAEGLGYTLPTLLEGTNASYAVDQYDSDKGNLVIVVTLSKTGETNIERVITIMAKDVDFVNDLLNIVDSISLKTSQTLFEEDKYGYRKLTSGLLNDGIQIGYHVPGLSRGVVAQYAMTAVTNIKKVSIKINLIKDGIKVSKTITMIARDNYLEEEKNKLKDWTSTDEVSSVAATLSKGSTDIKSQFMKIQGFESPDFAYGVYISKVVVKTALSSKKVVYTVTISDGLNIDTQDVTVTFA